MFPRYMLFCMSLQFPVYIFCYTLRSFDDMRIGGEGTVIDKLGILVVMIYDLPYIMILVVITSVKFVSWIL